jgi:hypothetical protein
LARSGWSLFNPRDGAGNVLPTRPLNLLNGGDSGFADLVGNFGSVGHAFVALNQCSVALSY